MKNIDPNVRLFEGKVVLITGAGAGIGRGFAMGFSRDGAHVVGFSRNAENLARTAELCGPGGMHSVVGDITDVEDVNHLFEEVERRYGRVDILVNNAAIYPKSLFLESSWQEWCHVLETNVFGMVLCCKKALPGMLERKYGRIINIGSFAWRGPIPYASAYSVSKAAVHVLTKSIAVEIDREHYPNVIVNELAPGMYQTGMSDIGGDPMEAYVHARYIASLPSGSPTGETYEGSNLVVEKVGIRAKVRRFVSSLITR